MRQRLDLTVGLVTGWVREASGRVADDCPGLAESAHVMVSPEHPWKTSSLYLSSRRL